LEAVQGDLDREGADLVVPQVQLAQAGKAAVQNDLLDFVETQIHDPQLAEPSEPQLSEVEGPAELVLVKVQKVQARQVTQGVLESRTGGGQSLGLQFIFTHY